MRRLRKKEQGKEKKGGGEGFQDVSVAYNIKIHSSHEIKDLVETHHGNIVCDTPIASMFGRRGGTGDERKLRLGCL